MNRGVAWALAPLSYAHCFYAMSLPHPLAPGLWGRFRRGTRRAPTFTG